MDETTFLRELEKKTQELSELFRGREREGEIIMKELSKLQISYKLISRVPDDVWKYILTPFQSTGNITCSLMRVCKTWMRVITQSEKLQFMTPGIWIRSAHFFRQWSHLTDLKIYDLQDLDFSFLINLKHLTLRGMSLREGKTKNYQNLQTLTNLISLSIKGNKTITNGVLLNFPASLHKSIKYLSVNQKIKLQIINIFKNLEKLNLKEYSFGEEYNLVLPKLVHLKCGLFGARNIHAKFCGRLTIYYREIVAYDGFTKDGDWRSSPIFIENVSRINKFCEGDGDSFWDNYILVKKRGRKHLFVDKQ